MLSRLAESFYWLSRNVERAETVARVLDVTWTRAMDFSADDGYARRSWRTAYALGTFAHVANVEVDGAAATLQRCVLDPGNSSSIASTVTIARSNGIGVRAELPVEAWETLNELYLVVQAETLGTMTNDGPSRFLRRVRERCQGFAGVSDATMLHDDGWHFLQLGRMVERCYAMARMLATIESLDDPWPEWQRLLEMSSASMPFARASSVLPTSRDALRFLLFDPRFPRSVRFCANDIDAILHRISETVGTRDYVNQAEKLAGRLAAACNYTSIEDVLEEGLDAFVSRVHGLMEDLLGAVQSAYFPRVPVTAVTMRGHELVTG